MAETPTWFEKVMRPLWVRLAIILFCVAWTAWEWLYGHDQLWQYLTIAVTLWGIWELIVTYDKKRTPPGSAPKP